MKIPCEICGREFGLFERSYHLENNKLGIDYESLCGECRGKVLQAINIVNTICEKMLTELHGKLASDPYAQNNINVLIFLAVREVFQELPEFKERDNLITETFYPGENTVPVAFDNLVEIVYKVLRNSFMAVLGRYGLDTLESFAGYMGRECLFFEQIKANCGKDGAMVYCDLFVCPSGLIFLDTENNIVRSLYVSQDRTLKFTQTEDDVTYNIDILKQRYHNLKKRPEICFNRKDQRDSCARKIASYNNAKKERIESELSAMVQKLNIPIERDLRELHPNEALRDIPLDSVLVCIVKTLFEEDITQDYVREAPDGLLALIVDSEYPENFERSGMVDVSEIQDYISDACLFITDFNSSFSQNKMIPSFAFLTPQAYLISQLGENEYILNSREGIPNDLYTGYQHMIFQGRDEFFIPISKSKKGDQGYYFLDGIRIFSKKQRPLKELESFFAANALNYYQEMYDSEKGKIDSLKEKELADTARRIFIGYGYLPFTLYDEWAAIERNIRESDILMKELVPQREKMTGSHHHNIFYAGRTVNAFEQQAGQLAESFDIKDLPVARALLWEALKEEVKAACSEELVRLAGDFLNEGDTLEEAIVKYSALEAIEPEKAYFLGLFIYYLMDKGILDDTSFLDHYNHIASLYLKENPQTEKIIEFTELQIPEKQSFDIDTEGLEAFNNQIQEEKAAPVSEESFMFSIRTEAEDLDSDDNLAEALAVFTPTEDDGMEYLTDIITDLEQEELPVVEEKKEKSGISAFFKHFKPE